MLLILEIAMIGAGLYALFTGKVPAFIVGGGRYQVNSTPARLMGVIMLLPIPLTFVFTFIAGFMMASSGPVNEGTLNGTAIGIEIALVIGTALLILVLFRMYRQPVVAVDAAGNVLPVETEIEAQIAKKTNGSLIYLVLGGLGVTAIILCPLVYLRTTEALKLIDQYHVGEQYRGKANTLRVLSMVILVGWLAIGGCFIGSLLIGSV